MFDIWHFILSNLAFKQTLIHFLIVVQILICLSNCSIYTTPSAPQTSTLPIRQLYCPQKCVCQDKKSVVCYGLNRIDLLQLFAQNSKFINEYAENLQNFTLKNSQLKDLSNFPTQFKQLLFLDLSENELENLETLTSSTLLNPFVQLGSVIHLNLNSFLRFPNVEEINLKSNGIFSVDWEAFRLYHLKRLYLSKNHLPTISEHMLRFTPNLELLDLSNNQLTIAQSSSFFAAQRLSQLDLSFNRIQRFHYDSFTPLFQDFLQLESLNLAYNNLTRIPPDLRQFIALRTLNLSGNPIEKILQREIVQPVLQVLDVSNCSKLRLIESRAFSKVPNLQTAILANNHNLRFVSPSAFENVSLLFELNLSNNMLSTLDEAIIKLPTRIHLYNNPWDCNCIATNLQKYKKHIIANSATNGLSTFDICSQKTENREFRIQNCGEEPLMSLELTQTAEIGELFAIYCAGRMPEDKIIWTLPNGTHLYANYSEVNVVFKNIIFLAYTSKPIK